ncbi:hypothetical protein C8R45DRAFT_928931 [Mycena sanguinolenta]|nr:hypothetical protein C8R45DRAFT_928931 [Mycena sanguinolenta]
MATVHTFKRPSTYYAQDSQPNAACFVVKTGDLETQHKTNSMAMNGDMYGDHPWFMNVPTSEVKKIFVIHGRTNMHGHMWACLVTPWCLRLGTACSSMSDLLAKRPPACCASPTQIKLWSCHDLEHKERDYDERVTYNGKGKHIKTYHQTANKLNPARKQIPQSLLLIPPLRRAVETEAFTLQLGSSPWSATTKNVPDRTEISALFEFEVMFSRI